jgi:hypothetical protein
MKSRRVFIDAHFPFRRSGTDRTFPEILRIARGMRE